MKEMPKLLDILLQRNDSAVPWGFEVRGGLEVGTWPIISSVIFGTLASQYLNAGDKILEIQKQKANYLLQSEIERIIEDDGSSLAVLVEKLPSSLEKIKNNIRPKPLVVENGSYEVVEEKEWFKEKGTGRRGVKQSMKIWLRETNPNLSMGDFDIHLNFERTRYKPKEEKWYEPRAVGVRKSSERSRNQKRMQMMSESFEKYFKEKIGEWLEVNMLGADTPLR